MFLSSNPIFTYIANRDFAGLAIYLLALLLAMCIAVSFHEWAHAFVAYKLGDPTAKNMGRMTIDPTKHFTFAGLLCFLFFRVGFAKPVIVNSRNLKNFRRDDALISVAGVVMNIIMAFLAYGILFFVLYFKYDFPVKDIPDYVLIFSALSSQMAQPYLPYILALIFSINISFAVFNILPVPPLDGFHLVSSIFVRKSYKVVNFLMRYGYLILIILIFTGIISRVLSPVIMGLSSAFGWFFSLFV